MAFYFKSYRDAFPPPHPPPVLREDNGNKLLCYIKILKCFLAVVTHINTVRVVCDAMSYWTIDSIFTRYTCLESLWFGTDERSPLILLIPPQKIAFNNGSNIKYLQCCLKRRPREATVYRSFVLRLKQDCRYQSVFFSFGRCLWSVDLRNKLPNIKHY